jgi:hypothetical protein
VVKPILEKGRKSRGDGFFSHTPSDNFGMIKYALYYTLIAMVLFFVPSGCGIPDYPYLYPPESLDVEGQIGFKHDPDNDPGVFEGYEIYYRIYQQPADDTDIEAKIVSDMIGYFNSTTSFNNISREDYPSNVWYRRVIITDTGDGRVNSIPHIDVSEDDCEKDFSVELTRDPKGYMYFQFSPGYSGDDLRGYSNIELLLFSREDFLSSPSDFVDTNTIDLNASLFIAFFAVPFGRDDVNLTDIYANGTSSDMLYIGKVSLSSEQI